MTLNGLFISTYLLQIFRLSYGPAVLTAEAWLWKHSWVWHTPYLSALDFWNLWFMKLIFELDIWTWFFNLIFTACVTCKNSVRNRQKIKCMNKFHELEISKNQMLIDRGWIYGCWGRIKNTADYDNRYKNLTLSSNHKTYNTGKIKVYYYGK